MFNNRIFWYYCYCKDWCFQKRTEKLYLQYSTDGITYNDVTTFSLMVNKAMEKAFENVKLPDGAANCEKLYIADPEKVG